MECSPSFRCSSHVCGMERWWSMFSGVCRLVKWEQKSCLASLCSAGEGHCTLVNKLLIMSPQLSIYLSSPCFSRPVYSVRSLKHVLFQRPAALEGRITMCIAPQCTENALSSSRRFMSFFVTYCRIYLP